MFKLLKKNKRILFFWITLFLGIIIFFQFFSIGEERKPIALSYSEFLAQAKEGQFKSVTIKGKHALGDTSSGDKFRVYTAYPRNLLEKLEEYKVDTVMVPTESEFSSKLPLYMPLIILLMVIGLFYALAKSIQASGSKALGFGRSRAKPLSEKSIKVRFNDVAGIDEAKEELQSIVDFLKDPKKFERLGGKIPKGVLLYGPPGNGKTLLARAIAGEAGVVFFPISGSDFVEMVVGVGASRVRDLFDQAKKCAPCIIFIDELDAVGRKRNAGHVSGGHEEREQTLNQLLVEMDGFEGNKGIIVVGATNRADVLDQALLRPGRFDRRIRVNFPDLAGRKRILEVHTRNVPLFQDVDLQVIARGTPGFSGADLSNLVNEAALYAAQTDKLAVNMDDFEYAKDKILMGVASKGRILSEEERALVAHHEAGHAIVAYYTKGAQPIHKVTIMPRGGALGMVVQLPEKDQVLMSREQAIANIMVAMGGRIAEEQFFGYDKVTSGASNDIEQATKIVRRMVTEWALSTDTKDKTPFQNYMPWDSSGYQHSYEFSESVKEKNDKLVEKILEYCYTVASKLVTSKKTKLKRLAKALLEYETLSFEEVKNILDNNKMPERAVGSSPSVLSRRLPKTQVDTNKNTES